MGIFITGGNGFIGSAVVKELVGHGYRVIGLARSDKAAEQLKSLGATIIRGDLNDHETMSKAASESDGVLHLAFNHGNFSDMEGASKMDQAAIKVMGAALEGTNKPLVVTTGTLPLASGQLVDEDSSVGGEGFLKHRAEAETLAKGLAEKGVRSMVARLSPTNHGEGDVGFVPMIIKTARAKGEAAYIGEGSTRWPAVHRLDTAKLYRLMFENGKPGGVYHAVAEQAVTQKAIAEAIGKGLNIPVVSKSSEEAGQHFGWMAGAISLDNPTSSEKTQKELGWTPDHPTLLEDLASGFYFAT